MNDWTRRLLEADRLARVIVLGDLNDFEFSETPGMLERGERRSGFELVDLWRLAPEREHYSYVFQGNGQVLDHILESPRLLRPLPDYDAVHMNSEFSAERQSDHDPPIARVRP